MRWAAHGPAPLRCPRAPRTIPPMSSPKDRKYSTSHEWHKLDDAILTLGITKFAVDELTDVTYVQMKPVGTRLGPGDSVGEVESVKATSDVYSVAGGEIIEINGALADDPSLVNTDPYGRGWLVKLRVSDSSPLNGLMDGSTYDSKYAG